jgi:hypothetical protein
MHFYFGPSMYFCPGVDSLCLGYSITSVGLRLTDRVML